MLSRIHVCYLKFFQAKEDYGLKFFSSCFPVLLLIPKRIRDKEIVPTAVLENMKVGKNRTVHSVVCSVLGLEFALFFSIVNMSMLFMITFCF